MVLNVHKFWTKQYLLDPSYNRFKLILLIWMRGIRFENVIAVGKWWDKPICMLSFSQYISLNVHYLSDSIYRWNCCNKAQSLNKKIIIKRFAIKVFTCIFFTTPNSKNITLRIVTIKKSELTFLLILYFHVNMNGTKVKVCKKFLKEICVKLDGTEEFIKEEIEEICSHEKLSVEEVICF